MKRDPVDFGSNFVGEPPADSWPRAVIAAVVVFVFFPAVTGLVIAGIALAATSGR